MDSLRKARVFVTFLLGNFLKDGCQVTAAALTYQTLFAVVPLLTVTYALLSAFQAFSGMGELIESFIFDNVVPENVAVVQDYLRGFSDQALNLSVPSLLLLAVTAFLMMFTIERTFNQIWLVREPRQGFQRILVYWAVLTVGPFLLGGGLVITTYVFSLPLISDVAETTAFLHLLPVMLSAVMFTLIYIVIPNCYVPLRYAVSGGLAVAIAFELAKQLFAAIMAKSDFEVIYGTFAAVPLFLLWIYVSWTIILFGAELVKGLGLYRFQGSDQQESAFIQSLLVLDLFFQCHKAGELVTEEKLQAQSDRIDMELWPEVKDYLTGMNLIRPVDRGGLVLSRDLNEVSIWDLHQGMPWQLPAGSIAGARQWETRVTESLADVFAYSQEKLDMDLESLFRTGDAK